MEESESKQWSVAEGVSGRGEGKGVCREGVQSPRVLTQATFRRGQKFVYLWVCVLAGCLEGLRVHKVVVLQSWHVVCVCRSVMETHSCSSSVTNCFSCLIFAGKEDLTVCLVNALEQNLMKGSKNYHMHRV